MSKPRQRENEFYVRDLPASTLTDVNLSPGAHHLLTVMLAKADAKTGELRIGEHWLSQADIFRAAHLTAARTARRYLQNLVESGYVVSERGRMVIAKDGRKRNMKSQTKYTVFKTPLLQTTNKKPENEEALQRASDKHDVSSTGQSSTGQSSRGRGMAQQDFQKSPGGPGESGGLKCDQVHQVLSHPKSLSQSPTDRPPDESSLSKPESQKSETQIPGRKDYVLPSGQTAKPETVAWCRKIIFKRANGPIQNPRGYFAKAIPEFLINFTQEVEWWLMSELDGRLGAAMEKKQMLSGSEVYEIVCALANEARNCWKLVVTEELLRQILDLVAENRGWTRQQPVGQSAASEKVH